MATATPGVCDSNYCKLMPLFLVVILATMLCIFVAGIFHLQIGLRCVRGDSRPLAMSVDTVIGRLGGSFPGPLLFGAVLDASCILWEEKCDKQGSCLYYDNHQMAWYMLILCAGCKVVNIFFGVLAWVVYKNKHTDDLETQILREVSSSSRSSFVDELSRDVDFEPTDGRAVNGVVAVDESFNDATKMPRSTVRGRVV